MKYQDDIRYTFDFSDVHLKMDCFNVTLNNASHEPPRRPWDIPLHDHNSYEIHFIASGSGRFTVAELLTYSVAQSDNNVCDVLFRFLGGTEAVDRYIAGLGIGETVIVADEEMMHRHTDNQYLNRTTPLAAVRLLERFRRGELLSAAYGDFLLETMFATETGPDKLRGLLPADVAVAHKTGSSDRDGRGVKIADNDIGIVRLPDGRSYSIAVFVMDSREDDRTNAAVIARISRLVYDYAARR